MCVGAPGSNHSLATAPTGRTLASLCLISFWDGSSPKGPLSPETSWPDKMCRKIAGQTNSLALLQTNTFLVFSAFIGWGGRWL